MRPWTPRRWAPGREEPVGRDQGIVPQQPVDGFGPIAEFLNDDRITEILINGPGVVWVEVDGAVHPTTALVNAHEIELLAERLLTPLGLRVDRSAPIADARMVDGSRVNIVTPPLAVDGPCVSIRRFPAQSVPLSAFGPPDMVRVLAELMAAEASIAVAGRTSSGKTTLINALAELIPDGQRIICIEDTAELQIRRSNLVRLEARSANSEGVGEVTLRRLVLTALRMRPDRIIVGEVRGAEAFDLLLALTSGHRGCLTSCHASDEAGAIRRLETLASLAGSGLQSDQLRQMIGDGLDAVVATERIDGARFVQSISLLDDGHPAVLWRRTGHHERALAC